MIVEFETSKGKFKFVKVSDNIGTANYQEAEFKSEYQGKPVKLVHKLTEEDWKEVVDWGSYINTYKNYITNDNHKSNQLQTATESGKSLMESLNLPMGNWLLIKYEN